MIKIKWISTQIKKDFPKIPSKIENLSLFHRAKIRLEILNLMTLMILIFIRKLLKILTKSQVNFRKKMTFFSY